MAETKSNTESEFPHLGNFINYYIQTNGFRKGKLAKELGILPTTLNQYFKQKSLKFETLFNLSKALNHNFLAHLGEYLHIPYETEEIKELKTELQTKNELIKKLETELEVYKRITER